MHARKQSRQGFTLVEILIVVVILGILAAIVIPQFTSASEDARASSLVSQLQTIRSQLELYQVQNNGEYPDLAGSDADEQWEEMTDTGDRGPYLQQTPRNPFGDESDGSVNVVSSEADLDSHHANDWNYYPDTGQIKANVTVTSQQNDDRNLNLRENDVNFASN